MKIEDRRNEAEKQSHKVYVVARDKFLSGWGMAQGGTSYIAWACADDEVAQCVEKKIVFKPEMKNVRITRTLPRLKGSDHLMIWPVSYGHVFYPFYLTK